jgi:hypothetical protein
VTSEGTSVPSEGTSAPSGQRLEGQRRDHTHPGERAGRRRAQASHAGQWPALMRSLCPGLPTFWRTCGDSGAPSRACRPGLGRFSWRRCYSPSRPQPTPMARPMATCEQDVHRMDSFDPTPPMAIQARPGQRRGHHE